jgi:hypothetical protein
MMQRLQNLPVPLRIVAYAVVAAALLAIAAGVGAMAALTLGPDGGSPEEAKPERAEKANPGQGGGQEDAGEGEAGGGEGASDGSSKAAYLNGVADVQNGSVELSLLSNNKLQRYDSLTADDVEDMKADAATLESYDRRARDLDPPTEYEDQHRVFVRAISELRDADELAYRLASDLQSATQADFEAYDRHVDRATAYLRRSNEMLGKDYKTTQAAQEISLG